MKNIDKRYNDNFLKKFDQIEEDISKKDIFSFKLNECEDYSKKFYDLLKELDKINKDCFSFYLKSSTIGVVKKNCKTYLDAIQDKSNRILKAYLQPINYRINEVNNNSSRKRDFWLFFLGAILGTILSILTTLCFNKCFPDKNKIDKSYFENKINSIIATENTLILDSISSQNKRLTNSVDSLSKEIKELKKPKSKKVKKKNKLIKNQTSTKK